MQYFPFIQARDRNIQGSFNFCAQTPGKKEILSFFFSKFIVDIKQNESEFEVYCFFTLRLKSSNKMFFAYKLP